MSRGLITVIKEQGVVPEALTTASGPSLPFATELQSGRFRGEADMAGVLPAASRPQMTLNSPRCRPEQHRKYKAGLR
jgi:hypothetical protein